MSSRKSYKRILLSSSVIGGAMMFKILIALLRTKVVAVLLGPAGIGLIGLFQNLMLTASSLSSMGLGNVGTRQIAEARGLGEADAVAAARRALFWGTLILAFAGALVFWLLRGEIAARVLGDPARSGEVGWLALGVALTVASGSQLALLNGLRRIGHLARVSMYSALLASVLGIGALLLWHERGLIAFVIAAPLASFLLGHVYVARLPKLRSPRTPLVQLLWQWRALIRLGAAFMGAGLAVTAGQLVVRTMVQNNLGAAALGQFQAAWVISMTYVGFVLAAMGTDYYPRLTAVIRDHAAVNRMVNEQTKVGLLLAAPVFLLTLGFAPWIIKLLYSSQFSPAVEVLRWQVLGDILKMTSWPLGFILLAAGAGRTYLLSESLAMAVFAGLSWIGLPLLGVSATGVGFLGMYVVYLPLVYCLARRRTKFKWTPAVRRLWLTLLIAAVAVFVQAGWSVWAGAVTSIILASLAVAHAIVRLTHMAGLTGPVGKMSSLIRGVLGKMGVKHD